jgi:hypothetical protein
MPLIDTDNVIANIMCKMQRHVGYDDNRELAGCLREYAQVINDQLIEPNADDCVVVEAIKLRQETIDLANSLDFGRVGCGFAFMIFKARTDNFVYGILEPWIRKKYGDECVFKHTNKSIGKA